ncbi:MAG: ATP-binding protein [Bacteroidales bacterium]|jgi:MinD superfamily P-loop ATPase|nr:ATP-binding protein [Bacteroidales bacterium]
MMKIAIASGKGGTGKTFIATNIFYTLLQNNYRAMLVDCDAEAPNSIAFFETKQIKESEVTQLVPVINKDTCTFCGKCHEYCNYNAIFILPPMKVIQVIEDLCHGCGACSVACKVGAISEKPVSLGQVALYSTDGLPGLIEARMNIGVMSPVPVIKAAIRQVDNKADIIIMDAPPGTSCPFIQTVASADYVILVTEPTPFGLSDLKQSVETLKTINKPCGVIINRSGLGNNEVQEYLSNEDISLLLEIPFKKEIAELYSRGKIVSENDSFFACQLSEVIRDIIEQHGNSHNQR